MTPAEIVAALQAAQPGDTVVTGPNTYPLVLWLNKMDLGGVTLDATGATFEQGVAVNTVTGLNIKGGTYGTREKDTTARYAIMAGSVRDFSVFGAAFLAGPGGDRGGIQVRNSQFVTVRDNYFSGYRTAIMMLTNTDILVVRNVVRDAISDGLNIVDNHRGIISANDCEWHVRHGLNHPDGIQLWSLSGKEPQADIWVINNRCVGVMQGILSSDPKTTPSGVRLSFHGNFVWVTFSHTLTAAVARDCVATHNVLASHPGALFGANPGKIKGLEDPSNTVADNLMWPGTVNPPPRRWWLGVPDIHGLVGSVFDDRSFNPPVITLAPDPIID